MGRFGVRWIICLCLLGGLAVAEDAAPMLLVRVGVVRHFPPQYSLSEDGSPRGFAIDIMEAIATDCRFRLSYVVYNDWPETFQALQDGRVDLIPNLGMTSRRADWADYSIPVETFAVSIFTRQQDQHISSQIDLAGHSVGVVRGNVGETLGRAFEGATVRHFNDQEDALFGLLSGNVRAVLYPSPVFWKMAVEARVEERIRECEKPLMEVRRAMAVYKGRLDLLERINPAIRRLLVSPRYKEIYTRWYARPPVFWTGARVALFLGAVLLSTAVGMFLWRYHSLRRLNAQLRKNIEQRRAAEVALQEANERLEERVHERTGELEDALANIKTLHGLLPICSNCKKIRNDEGCWDQLEGYIVEHSEAQFSHSLCPDCLRKIHPALYERLCAEGKIDSPR